MVTIESFHVKNFKGVENVKLIVEGGKAPGRFVSLIGLNEGGKTSIIEALSQTILQDPQTSDLLEATQTNIDLADVVPKHHSAGFSGKSELIVELDFGSSPAYEDEIKEVLKSNNLVLASALQRKINITKWYSFEDSVYKSNGTTWDFLPKVKKPTGNKEYSLYDLSRPAWGQCLTVIKKYLPRSIYFPTFLIDFPKRVYLEGDYGKVDSYYRSVVADALNGLSNPLSVDTHIISRVNKHRKPGETFSSALRSSHEGRLIDATVQALATELNRVVFGAWAEIFKKPVTNRQIVAEWHIDEQQDNHLYLEFSILAGDHRFYISERSVGFRWFFSFLLFTQFQGARADGRKIVFLFDEPASHLHPKAQERLLKSFEKIAKPNHVIIYSTHSHYLINPLWLEQAYIVSNSAIDAEKDETGIKTVGSRVKISASKYKTFVSDNPSKTTYYQPVLDVLDHSAGEMDLSDPVIVLEGKFDYYPFRYLLDKIGRGEQFKIIPAVGAGGMSALIGILRAWGLRFFVILDDDDAGRKEKAKYKSILMLQDNQVATLDELSPKLKGKEFEGLFQSDIRSAAVKAGFGEKEEKIDKAQFYSYFQSLKSGLRNPEPMADTTALFQDLISKVDGHIISQ